MLRIHAHPPVRQEAQIEQQASRRDLFVPRASRFPLFASAKVLPRLLMPGRHFSELSPVNCTSREGFFGPSTAAVKTRDLAEIESLCMYARDTA